MKLIEITDADGTPLLVDMLNKLLSKGERIDFTWTAPMEYSSGQIVSIDWSIKNGLNVEFKDTTQDGITAFFDIAAGHIDWFDLTKGANGKWYLSGERPSEA